MGHILDTGISCFGPFGPGFLLFQGPGGLGPPFKSQEPLKLAK